MFKAAIIFFRTLCYLLRSYFPKANILALKKEWAEELARRFGIRIEAKGMPPSEAPVIIVGNHISYLDIIILMAVHPQVTFLAKKEVGEWPIIGPTARRVDTLFVNRTEKNKAQVRRQIAQQLLDKKSQLAVFPSGTTTLHEELPWKKGMFEIAQEYSIPVKAFKISYSHPRECAYIGEDNMLEQMAQVFKAQGKVAYFEWLDTFHITSPEEEAETVRKAVVAALQREA
ncbi:lysophospholipid acyltransferase family protein [Pseudobdellovibrio exovorus]|uniref:Phospholipid/glycerol acyltransferase domain-containing protein n=1 Tax=Pseudobdellovibrio exovorus JSS TaxID=1184267 RepID=M4V6G2_9BACT|nr:lysophospholipid acyltransferase family protein [Pseudobdellovibrio exovorus]AGH94793.1 hypothetical protein A11Q_573 [Pseudobdellovibrio exovorus JSS]